MRIQHTSEAQLSEELAAQISRLQQEAFPQTEAFKTRRWYGVPSADDDVWFTVHMDDVLAASVRVVHRPVEADGGEMVLAGIGNVCSSPAFRGMGVAKACMQAVGEYIETSGTVDFGMLFCQQHVRDYYVKLGWTVIDNETLADGEQSGAAVKSDRFTLIYPGARPLKAWPTSTIFLKGPRW